MLPGVNLEDLILTVSYVGLFLIVFAETGLLIGFFLPGDTLLITAGLLAGRGELELLYLIPLLIIAAVIGDAVGFEIGKNAGPRLFKRDESRFFKKRHLLRAEEFYEKHGGKTIIIARFLAFVRTFAPTVAGAAGMPYRRFVMFNVTGAALWVISITLLGYWFGKTVERIDLLFSGMVVVMVGASVAPALFHIVREWRKSKRAAAQS